LIDFILFFLVDSSADMLRKAPTGTNLSFVESDIQNFNKKNIDVIVSNAALHWIQKDDFFQLFERFQTSLNAKVKLYIFDDLTDYVWKGTLAFQVPNMWNAPSHRAVHKLRNAQKFREKVGVQTPQLEVKPKEEFFADLKKLNFQNFNIWETEYLQLLSGSDAVFEWLLGTTLRPIMAQLDATEQQEFGTDLKELLAKEYPQLPVIFFFFFFFFFFFCYSPPFYSLEKLLSVFDGFLSFAKNNKKYFISSF
jgi:trans-aconitate 2-methyltransferase